MGREKYVDERTEKRHLSFGMSKLHGIHCKTRSHRDSIAPWGDERREEGIKKGRDLGEGAGEKYLGHDITKIGEISPEIQGSD